MRSAASSSPLDNPMWSALTTKHSHLAERQGEVLRYPAPIAPFCAVPHADVTVDPEPLLANGTIFFVGVVPRLIPGQYETGEASVVQMIHRQPIEEVPKPLEGEVSLSIDDAEAMVELTELAFPGFFRRATVQLGRYIGIRKDGRLVAMAGERLRTPGLYEISGVCTHPDYTGQGYARHLIRRLLRRDAEETPFLHADRKNERAIKLYESLGFELAAELASIRISKA